MAPKKIMVIRHAEKPVPEGANGVEADGRPAGPDSLSAIGWDRARALVNFFAVPTAERIERPDYVFAAAVEVSSQRPRQTVSPLAASLRPPSGAGPAFNVQYPKEDIAGVTTAVMSANGIVLICWEHRDDSATSREAVSAGGKSPKWHGARFDVVWVLDAIPAGWLFDGGQQMLLPGDKNKIIK